MRATSPGRADARRWHGMLLGFVLAYAIAAVALALVTGPVHDYKFYQRQWFVILFGGEPWSHSSTYGPLHNLFAYVFWIWKPLPKVLFALCGAGCSYLLLKRLLAENPPDLRRRVLTLLAAFPFNPLVIFATYYFGQNDIVCALLIVLAFLCRERGWPLLAGLCIGIAALEKFYPLVFGAYLMLDRDRVIGLRVFVSAVVVFAVGMAASWLVWGPKTFWALQFASGREAKLLSIYRFLQCFPDLVGGEAAVQAALGANFYVMLAISAVGFVGLHALGATWRTASALGVLPIFAAYALGHPQFYVSWMIPVCWIIIAERGEAVRRLGDALFPAALTLAIIQLVYGTTGFMNREWAWLRCYVSLPFLAAVLWGVWFGVRALWQPPKLGLRLRW